MNYELLMHPHLFRLKPLYYLCIYTVIFGSILRGIIDFLAFLLANQLNHNLIEGWKL